MGAQLRLWVPTVGPGRPWVFVFAVDVAIVGGVVHYELTYAYGMVLFHGGVGLCTMKSDKAMM